MAEFMIALVGFAVAVPGVAVAFAQCGEYLHGLASRFSNAGVAVDRIGSFGHDLHHGKLKLNIQAAEYVFSADDVDDAIKDAVEDSLKELKDALTKAASTLETCFDKKGNIRRTRFALFNERKLSRTVNDLKRWQEDFESIVDLVDKKRRLAPADLLLSRDKLRVIHKADGQDYEQISETNIFVADTEYMDQGVMNVRCLIEWIPILHDMEEDEVKTTARTLASKLSSNTSDKGILHCLGYRMSPTAELVFRLPEGSRVVGSLSAAISATEPMPYGGYPLQDRVRLCRELCDAVLRVHSSGLVHKHIRSNTILLLSQHDQANASGQECVLGSPFLTTWFMLRKMTELSSRRGADDWREDIYRHPHRQGRQPEERYNMGHDIYSLGVVLLEIALWEPLVQQSESSHMSLFFVQTALEHNLVSPTEVGNIEKLTHPLTVQKCLVSIARSQVSPIFGTSIANFIQACLTCLEDGIQGLVKQDFQKNPDMVAVAFHELFTQTFSDFQF